MKARATHLLLPVALLVALALGPAAARAAPKCSFGVANALAFGTYDPLAAVDADSMSTLSYRCPPGQAVRISLDRGLHGTYAAREMRMGPERLVYNLYLDAQRSIVWGDGTDGSAAGPGVVVQGGGTNTAYVFGRIPADQDVIAGVYSDTITVLFEL